MGDTKIMTMIKGANRKHSLAHKIQYLVIYEDFYDAEFFMTLLSQECAMGLARLQVYQDGVNLDVF